ncbi:Set1 complex component shg1 [Taphrina deformans PYCC 5710]|uniref:Set1 complex component shg1 n=1 Tax=Taphrina deformans (strain PYCC 5710 / ATCC 11124 / CBS 356.35 / IMI 108563 / JCM 9778 / NBRC 8474) TaxID=1097556 RepID=R4X830_TAPDE|nr:Set1 complex component shg1 [Taphrina deformans PYCC 5710]|eukprot:CCG81659.1 Set1 complex component shg1 [Taphrina deformans PYCC 5710]
MGDRTSGTRTTNTSEDKERAVSEAAEKAAIIEFKRSGDFDIIRKETLRKWQESSDGLAFHEKLKNIVDKEVERDRTLLARDRGKAATLLGGSVERTQLYPEARLAAAKNIFQTEEFKKRIYDSLKAYYPAPAQEKESQQPQTTATTNGTYQSDKKKTSAHDAAMAFITREQGA